MNGNFVATGAYDFMSGHIYQQCNTFNPQTYDENRNLLLNMAWIKYKNPAKDGSILFFYHGKEIQH